jgi:hypothetical protein
VVKDGMTSKVPPKSFWIPWPKQKVQAIEYLALFTILAAELFSGTKCQQAA